jgi:V/A-type H+/Na+-transporting ATPase subunit E
MSAMNSKQQSLNGLASSGVETLIERLREQGVEEGRREAEGIITDAHARAKEIEQAAEARAKELVEAAMQKADRLKTGGYEALRVAMRDTVLRLRSELTEIISDNVRRLITTEMDKEDFLRQLILDVAGQVRERTGIDHGEKVKVYVPRKLIASEELRQNPLELHEGGMTHLILNVAGDALHEGVTIGVCDDDECGKGIRLYLEDKDVRIDLTDVSVAELLLAHLQPRFRAVLEGTVK